MTELLPSDLVTRLARTRVVSGWLGSSGGIGDRRSRSIGGGMEFAEYRAYQPGDDVRHIDRFVYARSGQHHVRRFHVEQQLHGVVVVDASASMGAGEPPKRAHALRLAATFALAFVTGGDRARCLTANAHEIRWHTPVARHHQLAPLVQWLGHTVTRGSFDVVDVAQRVIEQQTMAGMVVLISDLMHDGLAAAVARLRGEGHEVLAVQVLSPDEADAALLGEGTAWLVDAESGERLPATLGGAAAERYRRAFDAWQGDVRAAVGAAQGRHVLTTTSDDVATLFTRTWRVAGLIR